ncbi:hypothetical protein BDW59DRAFT_138529 [Aspergillus cavernicola]|uniref:Uncharacterized protein n=1 Tax=Aspergillus cavernicola TaxID=176166 RepID=A0ABR4J000_9EURO
MVRRACFNQFPSNHYSVGICALKQMPESNITRHVSLILRNTAFWYVGMPSTSIIYWLEP